MPETTIAIDREQRAGLYEAVCNHLSGLGDIWLALEVDEDTDRAIPGCTGPRPAFPDWLEMRVEEVLVSGEKTVIRATATGTHKTELMGMPATDRGSADTGAYSTCSR